MHCRFWLLFILSVVFGAVLHAEFRTFTSDFGDSVEAELIELKEGGSIVRLKLRSGLKIESRITAFSQEDQRFMREWWAEKIAVKQVLHDRARLTVSAKMNRKSSANRYNSYASVDDKTRSFFPEVTIENDELNTFTGNRVRIVIIADDKYNKGQKLVVSAETLEASFPERSKTILESEPFRLRLYEYDSRYSNFKYEYGYEYSGYIVVIKNSKGVITHQRASKSKYLSDMKIVYNCRAGELYDEDFDHKLDARASSYFVK